MSLKTLRYRTIASVLTFILAGGSVLMWALALPSIPDQVPPDFRGWTMTVSLCAALMSHGAVWPFNTGEEVDYGNVLAGFVVCLMSIAIIAAAIVVFIRNFRCPTVGQSKWIAVLVVADSAFCVAIALMRTEYILLACVCLAFRAAIITMELLLKRSLQDDERAAKKKRTAS